MPSETLAVMDEARAEQEWNTVSVNGFDYHYRITEHQTQIYDEEWDEQICLPFPVPNNEHAIRAVVMVQRRALDVGKEQGRTEIQHQFRHLLGF